MPGVEPRASHMQGTGLPFELYPDLENSIIFKIYVCVFALKALGEKS